jgi:hypothetical protein
LPARGPISDSEELPIRRPAADGWPLPSIAVLSGRLCDSRRDLVTATITAPDRTVEA